MSDAIKPTPGPWVMTEGKCIYINAQVDGKRRFILQRSTGEGCGINVEAEQVRADCRLIAEAGTVFHNTGLSPVQLVEMVKELKEALTGAQQAINSMKVEAETAAQGDEQMMLEACETISNEGLDADMAIRAALAKCEGVKP